MCVNTYSLVRRVCVGYTSYILSSEGSWTKIEQDQTWIRKRNRSTVWKDYVSKDQESCNYSYRLSKSEQLWSGISPVISLLFVSLPLAQPKPYFAGGAEGALLSWSCVSWDVSNLFHNTPSLARSLSIYIYISLFLSQHERKKEKP
jgi:hypothetical protein